MCTLHLGLNYKKKVFILHGVNTVVLISILQIFLRYVNIYVHHNSIDKIDVTALYSTNENISDGLGLFQNFITLKLVLIYPTAWKSV